MNNHGIQRELLTEAIPPHKALDVALIKGLKKGFEKKFSSPKFQMHSTSPFSFLKRNFLHELKLRDLFSRFNLDRWSTKVAVRWGIQSDPLNGPLSKLN